MKYGVHTENLLCANDGHARKFRHHAMIEQTFGLVSLF